MEFEAQKAERGVYTLLGFAQKSGNLFSGGDVVAQALLKRRVRLVLLAWDLSENSAARFWQQLPDAGLGGAQVWRFGTKRQLGQAVGKPERGILALHDENFCSGLLAKLQILQSTEPPLAKRL